MFISGSWNIYTPGKPWWQWKISILGWNASSKGPCCVASHVFFLPIYLEPETTSFNWMELVKNTTLIWNHPIDSQPLKTALLKTSPRPSSLGRSRTPSYICSKFLCPTPWAHSLRAKDLGFLYPDLCSTDALQSGQIGFIVVGAKVSRGWLFWRIIPWESSRTRNFTTKMTPPKINGWNLEMMVKPIGISEIPRVHFQGSSRLFWGV